MHYHISMQSAFDPMNWYHMMRSNTETIEYKTYISVVVSELFDGNHLSGGLLQGLKYDSVPAKILHFKFLVTYPCAINSTIS